MIQRVLNLSYFHIEDARITISDAAVVSELPYGSLWECSADGTALESRSDPREVFGNIVWKGF